MNKLKNKTMVRECFDNFPEYSLSMNCVKWDYKNFIFVFVDEDEKEHKITMNKALKGLRLMKAAVRRGELPGLPLGPNWEYDAADWDGPCIDALAQFSVFGEVIYG